MKKVWEKPQIEIHHAIIPTEQYEQLLYEWAEVVYRQFCQLHKIDDQALVSETLLQRTGTDG